MAQQVPHHPANGAHPVPLGWYQNSTLAHEAAKSNVRSRVLRLSRDLAKSIKHRHRGVLQYLIRVGVPIHPQVTVGKESRSLIQLALRKDLPSAMLMRAHHAKLQLCGESTDPRGNPTQRLLRNMVDHPDQYEPGARDWVASLPARGDGPLATRMHAAAISMGADMPAVHPTWPPPGVAMEYSGSSLELAPERRYHVEQYWSEVAVLRREEAKALAPYYWGKLRRAARARAIFFYWLGLAQETQCAAGGAGRRADRAAYVKDGFAGPE